MKRLYFGFFLLFFYQNLVGQQFLDKEPRAPSYTVDWKKIEAVYRDMDLSDLIVWLQFLDRQRLLKGNFDSNQLENLYFMAYEIFEQRSSRRYIESSIYEESKTNLGSFWQEDEYKDLFAPFVEELFYNNEGYVVRRDGQYLVSVGPSSWSWKSPHVGELPYDESLVDVFEKSVKYPSYSAFQWDQQRQEGYVFLPEYNETIYLQDLSRLSPRKLIILFGHLYPLSKAKSVWEWELFGQVAMRKSVLSFYENFKPWPF